MATRALINGYEVNCLDVPVSKLNESKHKNNLTQYSYQYFPFHFICNRYKSQDWVFWS
jgi:hypothetical protein